MSLKVFFSHSMNASDLGIVYAVANQAKLYGIEPYIAELDVRPGTQLSEQIKTAIKSCDCLIAFLTHNGARRQWVRDEIVFAKGANVPVAPIVEKGVNIEGRLSGDEYIELDPNKPQVAISNALTYLQKLKTKKENQQAIGWLVIGAIFLFGMAASSR